MLKHTLEFQLIGVMLLLRLTVSGCGLASAQDTILQPPLGRLKKLPIAPESKRVDIAKPSFSNPTKITNPLFPISELHSVILLGHVDDASLRTETTLLPDTKTIDWNGQKVETLVSQYVAYLDWSINEVALDFYAQADDGSVWYLGEEVFNYENGIVADTEGTWLAGKDGPAAMIMPANPKVGNVFRPENVPAIVFEEVTVESISERVMGPKGPVDGAIIAKELHMDGTFSDKIFAPGYGEFQTGNESELEALALAVPIDALPGPTPAELKTLSTDAVNIFDAAPSKEWDRISAMLNTIKAAWDKHQAGDVPKRLNDQMSGALDALGGAIKARNPGKIRQTAIAVAQASLDLQLRHRSPAEIDLARLGLWTRQLIVDAAAGNSGAVTGDVVTLKWIRDRIAHTLDSSDVSRIDAQLGDLRAATKNLAAATEAAERLRDTLIGLRSGS